jgi:hypothetical protein
MSVLQGVALGSRHDHSEVTALDTTMHGVGSDGIFADLETKMDD